VLKGLSSKRNDTHKCVIDRPIKRTAIDDKLHLVLKHVRSGLRQTLVKLIAALAHDVPKECRPPTGRRWIGSGMVKGGSKHVVLPQSVFLVGDFFDLFAYRCLRLSRFFSCPIQNFQSVPFISYVCNILENIVW
jgi:hypothetical protein